MKGASEASLKKLHLQPSPNDYFYLRQGRCNEVSCFGVYLYVYISSNIWIGHEICRIMKEKQTKNEGKVLVSQ